MPESASPLRGGRAGLLVKVLALTVPVIAVIVLVTQAAVGYVTYRDRLAALESRAHAMAALTADAIARPLWNMDIPLVRLQLEALAKDPAFRAVRVSNPAGEVVAKHTLTTGGGAGTLAARAAVRSPDGDQRIGTVHLAFSTAALVNTAWRQALLGAGAFAVLLLGVGLTLRAGVQRLVRRPLARVLSAMERVERKDWATVTWQSNDELGSLAAAFNRMVEGLRAGDEAKRLLAELEKAQAELVDKNSELERTNGALMDSLTCASRLQTALLPDPETLAPLDDHFVLWRPRDVVGGDLYLARRTAHGLYLGVIDCTGHGVPGALMTMGAYAAFGHAVAHTGADTPAAVLTEMDRYMGQMLIRDDPDSMDHGLVIGLVRWQPGATTLDFAGGGIDLMTADPGTDPADVEIVKGERGGLGQRRRDAGRPFSDRTVSVLPGRAFYMASDGYFDQVGGPHARGFGRRRFRRVAGEQAGAAMADQEQAFRAALADWQGDEPQRDDITVFGFRPRPAGDA